MAKKTDMQRQLEESIRLAKERALPSQIKQDALGRRLRNADKDDRPTALDDPDTLPRRRKSGRRIN